MSFALKNPGELVARIGVDPDRTLLLVDAPEPLERLLAATRTGLDPLESVVESRLRGVKEEFDFVLVWREDRVGSQALLAAALKRLRPSGAIWVVTAMRKVIGPQTPAVHRLDLRDLQKAFEKTGLRMDREARFTSWHVGYRFSRETGAPAKSYST